MKKAIFFDKDGTLIDDVPYNVNPDLVVFKDGASEVIELLSSEFEFHIVTNQAGVALGLFDEGDLFGIERKFHEFFINAGTKLSGFHYCPHHPNGNVIPYVKVCDCRKPGTLMLERACLEYEIDPASSWLIGDILDDIQAGNRMGMNTILLDIGSETEWDLSEERVPDFKVNHLREVPALIAKVMYADASLARS